ncbi:hypothetical protein NW762_005555 [Fusarium torreyae]|uniref:Prion-inhibition and propagation HeLo domain-containing protein n=1 Tax=Fusarium torreyae TaxID=1237075 RepID=A0A9W8S1W1_9HYPO|nr:hypothetical protein NW762_005555 [Fusarium torreyae]
MAEVFGVVASALSVAALFNNCVDCFEYVQLGRQFGRDFERSQLKLDIARTRLGRWGESVLINQDPRFASNAPTDKVARLTQSILEEIVLLFQSTQKTSKRYEMVADEGDLGVLDIQDMPPIVRSLHHKLGALASRRQQNTSLAKKAKWALYDGKNLGKLIDQIVAFIDDLEKLVPPSKQPETLVEFEIEEVNDEVGLAALKDASKGIDPLLGNAVERKVDSIQGRNSVETVQTDEQARVQTGNVYTGAALGQLGLISDQTINSAGAISSKGQSGVQVGNIFGGKGIWD